MKTVDDYINIKPVTPDHRIAYGKHPEQFAELYLPTSGKLHATILLIHGGCWRAQFGCSTLGQLSSSLTTLGFAVWNLEFRRLGNGGGWTTTFEDIAKGADYLKMIAEEYSLDLSNVIAMGHSAGGHLALWLAGRHHLTHSSQLGGKQPLSLRGIVSLAGIPDLIAGVKHNICRGACQELVGGMPDEVPERYREASPHFLLPFNIPHWHLVGEFDPIVPIQYLQPFIEHAQNQDQVMFEIIPNIGHFELVMPDTNSWFPIKNAVLTISGKKNNDK